MTFSKKVVNRFVSRRAIPQREKEDVQMSIIEKFISKQDKITNNFQGNSKPSTYVIAVLNRMCLEIIRRDIKHWNLTDKDEDFHNISYDLSSEEKLAIKDETFLLQDIIHLFYDESAKINLFVALYYRLNIIKGDIKKYDLNYIKNNLIEVFNFKKDISKGDLFEIFAFAINKVEKKRVKSDATRMWLNKSILKMIDLLNGNFGRANYNKETFQMLFEYYYSNKEG